MNRGDIQALRQHGECTRGADKSLAYKENYKLQDWKNVFALHIPP
jgi:hypothetical protein